MVSQDLCLSLIIHHSADLAWPVKLKLTLFELIHFVARQASGGDSRQALKDLLRRRSLSDRIPQFVKIPMHRHSELFHGKRKFEHERGIVIDGHYHPG